MMRIGLCSSAAPDATLVELFELAARSGLTFLELRDLDGHGLSPGTEAYIERMAAAHAVADGVEITGYRSTEDGHDLWLARLSKALDAPILLDAPSVVRSRLNRARGIVEVGGRVAIATRGTRYLADAVHAAEAGADVAWDVRASQRRVGAQMDALLDAIGPRLRQVRLLGCAPEPSVLERHGIGAVMDRLAHSGYSGTVIFAPGSDRHRVAWSSWLGRGGASDQEAETSGSALELFCPPALPGGTAFSCAPGGIVGRVSGGLTRRPGSDARRNRD